MNLMRYPTRRTPSSFETWSDLAPFSNRLSRLFEDALELNGDTFWIPALDVEESAEELVLTADLPGLSVDDVSIEIENNVLTISGERRYADAGEDQQRRFHVQERRYGAFRRTLSLPRTVNADEISARFDSGVLFVHMPKVQEARARRIAIRSEG